MQKSRKQGVFFQYRVKKLSHMSVFIHFLHSCMNVSKMSRKKIADAAHSTVGNKNPSDGLRLNLVYKFNIYRTLVLTAVKLARIVSFA